MKQETSNTSFLLLLLGLTVVSAVVFFAVQMFFIGKDAPELTIEDEGYFQIGDTLEELYALETTIVAPEGADPYNYGLEDATSTDTVAPTGVIAFTGVNEAISGNSNIYLWEVGNPDALDAYIAPFIATSSMTTFIEFENIENPNTFFANMISSYSTAGKDYQRPEIHRLDIASGTIRYYPGLSSEVTARDLQYSPESQLLAFSRMKKPFAGSADMAFIGRWEVMVFDPNNNNWVDRIDGATDPLWSPDGTKLIVTKEDGFYLYDLPTKELTKILGVEEDGRLLTVTMSDLSPNKQFFVWTSGTAGLIAMNEITSWEPFEIVERGRISGGSQYYFPQFSPDSNYYVVQAIDFLQTGTTERLNPRFEIRPTLGRAIVGTLPLDGFSFNNLITDTWVLGTPTILGE